MHIRIPFIDEIFYYERPKERSVNRVRSMTMVLYYGNKFSSYKYYNTENIKMHFSSLEYPIKKYMYIMK